MKKKKKEGYVRVAAAQMKVTKSPEKNFQRILYFIERAAKEKVDIVCFPEACLLEYPYQARKKDPFIVPIKKECKRLSIHCIFGTYIKEKGNIFNCTFLIDDKGKIKYRYEKIHLWLGDQEAGVKPGRQNVAIKTKFGKIGIIVCYDINFPESSKKLAKEGAWVIFCPTFDILSKSDMRHMTKAAETISFSEPLLRAYEDQAYFVLVDAYTNPKISSGTSVICNPNKVLKKIKGREGLIFADISQKKIETIRNEEDLLK